MDFEVKFKFTIFMENSDNNIQNQQYFTVNIADRAVAQVGDAKNRAAEISDIMNNQEWKNEKKLKIEKRNARGTVL